MDGNVMVLRNKRSEYLFVEEVYEEVHYTLVDKRGEFIHAGNLPISLEIFMHCMYKAGYRKVGVMKC
jgi:hypothetical protein